VRSLAAAILWVVAAQAALAQAVSEPDLSGVWDGKYSYMASAGRQEVPFLLQLSVLRASVSGRITEPNTFGDRSSDKLFASVVGIVEGRRLRLVKTYDGTAGQRHSVYYEGTVDPGAMTITGNWVMSERWGGTFEAKRR
jgi:hypothetical protein